MKSFVNLPAIFVPISISAVHRVWRDTFAFAVLFVIFYAFAYHSGSELVPSAIPIHHDDYTNYASGSGSFTFTLVRPVSTNLIQLLALVGTDYLIWAVRLLTVAYVLLVWFLACEFYRPKPHILALIAFGVANFSTPVVIEYARYTGLVTHLLSGCFGLAAVLFLFRALRSHRPRDIGVSVSLIVLSALSKEDFILVYGVSLVFAAGTQSDTRVRTVVCGGAALALSTILIGAAKLMAGSSFLGADDASSSYYFNPAPDSLVRTAINLLSGASHPALVEHGEYILGLFVTVAVGALLMLLVTGKLAGAAYFVTAAVSVIAPYATLPNHVNAYYEMLWLPLLVAALAALAAEITCYLAFPASVIRLSPVISLTAAATTFVYVDSFPRNSIAHWYDSAAKQNAHVLANLADRRKEINETGAACVRGAGMFSPWYMHSGAYLKRVMGLEAKWYVEIEKDSPLLPGMKLGAELSQGQFILHAPGATPPGSCARFDFAEAPR